MKKKSHYFGSSGGLGLELVRVFLKIIIELLCCSVKSKIFKKNLNFSKQCEFKI